MITDCAYRAPAVLHRRRAGRPPLRGQEEDVLQLGELGSVAELADARIHVSMSIAT